MPINLFRHNSDKDRKSPQSEQDSALSDAVRRQQALLGVCRDIIAPVNRIHRSLDGIMKSLRSSDPNYAELKGVYSRVLNIETLLQSTLGTEEYKAACEDPAIEPEKPFDEEFADIPSEPDEDQTVPFSDTVETDSIVTDLAGATLLVVEDDLDLLQYLKEEFSICTRQVYTANNGVAAVNVLNTHRIDIIISDVMMPEMDGFSLCRHVKTTIALSHIPVILLTARTDGDSRITGYKNGADDYVTKPFDLEILKTSCAKLFMSRASARNMYKTGRSMPDLVETTFSAADESFMKRFSELVKSNITDPDLDTKFLVENIGVSRTVLFNKVKQLTGMNIQNYVNKVRMDYVIELMSTTRLPLSEIAEKSGFSSPRYFSTSFKNYTGLTPSQYKREKCVSQD